MSRALGFVVLALLGACSGDGGPPSGGGSTGIRFLADGEADGFARAMAPRELVFPRDHGPHGKFRTEWWYFTGNLAGDGGRHFGFELTFFRLGLRPGAAASWNTGQIWMAHLGVTDTSSERFVAAERLSRGALDLAGAESVPFAVWVEDWSARAPSGVLEEGVVLDARTARGGLELRLEAVKPVVLQGRDGLDAKGPEPGNASFYYSLTRMRAAGRIVDETGAEHEVSGLAWMDREWGTSALSPGVEGWDWFALQFEDGRELMLYRLRDRDGGTNAYSGGSLVAVDGRVVPLAASDMRLEARDYWTSPASGSRYPVAWQLELPELGFELDVRPRLDAQEMNLSVRYWEGAVVVTGSARGEPIRGQGYLELAGY